MNDSRFELIFAQHSTYFIIYHTLFLFDHICYKFGTLFLICDLELVKIYHPHESI